MTDPNKDLGENDAGFVDTFGDAVDKLRLLVEQYAQLFKNGARMPVLRRPSDIGLDYEDAFSRRLTAFRWKHGSSRPLPTSC